MLILSGQIGQKLDGSVPEDALEQLAVAWMNLRRNLSAAKMEVTDLVKITTYVVGKMDVTPLFLRVANGERFLTGGKERGERCSLPGWEAINRV